MPPRLRRSLLVLTAALAFLAGPAAAQVEVGGGVEVVSRYEWRGYALADGPAVQPGLSVAAGRWSFDLWASVASDRTAFGEADELDVTLAYEAGGPLGLSAGLTYYTFPNQGPFAWDEHTTPEVFVAVAPALPLHPELAVYYDANLGDGVYAQLGVGHAVAVGAHAVFAHVETGYDGGQFGAPAGVSHVGGRVGADLAWREATVTPWAGYTHGFEATGRTGGHPAVGLALGL